MRKLKSSLTRATRFARCVRAREVEKQEARRSEDRYDDVTESAQIAIRAGRIFLRAFLPDSYAEATHRMRDVPDGRSEISRRSYVVD